MTPPTHEDSLSPCVISDHHSRRQSVFLGAALPAQRGIATVLEISLDPVSEALTALYYPTGQGLSGVGFLVAQGSTPSQG